MAKILLIEDDPEVRASEAGLLKLRGHLIIKAANGLRGLVALTEEGDIDILLADYRMPEMDGYIFPRQ